MLDHRVSFGFQNFWIKAYEAFPRFWEVYPRLSESVDSLISRRYENLELLQQVIINLGILAGTSLAEITTLVGNGLGHGAVKIARSMLEVVINAEFLRQFPEHLNDYLDWHFVEQHQLLEFFRKDAPLLLSDLPTEKQNELDKDFEAVEHRFKTSPRGTRLRSGWCSKGLRARASQTDFQEAYKLIYPLGNKLLHGTIGGLAMHANQDSARIDVPPSLKYCKMALMGGHMCAVEAVETISKATGQEPSPPLTVLIKDYGSAWVEASQSSENSAL
jgi:hypothetical protein